MNRLDEHDLVVVERPARYSHQPTIFRVETRHRYNPYLNGDSEAGAVDPQGPDDGRYDAGVVKEDTYDRGTGDLRLATREEAEAMLPFVVWLKDVYTIRRGYVTEVLDSIEGDATSVTIRMDGKLVCRGRTPAGARAKVEAKIADEGWVVGRNQAEQRLVERRAAEVRRDEDERARRERQRQERIAAGLLIETNGFTVEGFIQDGKTMVTSRGDGYRTGRIELDVAQAEAVGRALLVVAATLAIAADRAKAAR